MLRVGLTGGIGCGKSTVAVMMRELGCHTIDADKIAHTLIEPGGAAYDEVVREFGADILRPDRRVDRSRVAAIVFAQPERLARLNAIVHPPLLAEIDHELARIARSDPQGIAVIDAALLIEFGRYRNLDRVVVVSCTPEQQLARLTDAKFGRGMTREQAESRIAAQLSVGDKRKLADHEIDTSGTIEETRRQVSAFVAQLKQLADASS